ncbi:MAG: phage major tail tube protein [Lachnospiraceae bacterium]|nr:phage major tail tube protein [Lachnospiraceae bacterium]
MSNYPSVINSFNAYNDGNRIIGQTGEITLPDVESKTTTVSGAGILGDIEEPVIGQVNSLKITIPFATIADDYFKLCNQLKSVGLTLRGAIQCMDTETGEAVMQQMRVVLRGKMATFTNGKLKAAEQMGASLTIELLYYMVELEGVTQVEIDKLNSVFIVNGVDVLEPIRNMC